MLKSTLIRPLTTTVDFGDDNLVIVYTGGTVTVGNDGLLADLGISPFEVDLRDMAVEPVNNYDADQEDLGTEPTREPMLPRISEWLIRKGDREFRGSRRKHGRDNRDRC